MLLPDRPTLGSPASSAAAAVPVVVSSPIAGAERICGRDILSNDQVNLLAILCTAMAAAATAHLFRPVVVEEEGQGGEGEKGKVEG